MNPGPVMLDIKGLELAADEREILQHPLVGGVILFSRNYHSPEQLIALVEDIQKLRSPTLLVSVDHEGGRVQRFREGFTALPPIARLGEMAEKDPAEADRLSELCGWLMAVELRAAGIDFSFAPVLDLNYEKSEVIGDRSFHRDPETVADLAATYLHGMLRAGMVATGKHFPGHGFVSADSHTAMPVDTRSFKEIYNDDIVPFARLIPKGLAGVMPAHVIYESVDPSPAGFSSFWLREVLRGRLDFQGVIFSDDLSMEGATVVGDVVVRANAALKAGCDMVLVCNDPDAAAKVIDYMDPEDDPVSGLRLESMRGRHYVNRRQLLKDEKWKKAVAAIEPLCA